MNSVFAQYEELPSPQFAVINLSLRLRLITANFGLDNSSYRAQPHSIIVKYVISGFREGFRIGFHSDSVKLKSASSNCPSSAEHSGVIDDYLTTEIHASSSKLAN